MTSLRLTNESEIPITNYDEPAQFGWREFYDFRNHVIQVLRQFGSAGPLGIVDLSVEGDDAPAFEHGAVDDPDFFVVDDMWNEHDKLSLVESDPKHIKAELIEALAEMASSFPGWRVEMKLGDCGLYVFGDKVVVGGRRFWDCNTVAELASRCAAAIDYGPPPPLAATMYPLWLAVVSGEFKSSQSFPAPPDRQWQEAIRALDELRRREPSGSPLKSFSYDRIRRDLHPHTRLQLAQRFFNEVPSYAHTTVENARRNVLAYAGESMAWSTNSDDRESVAQGVSAAQLNVATWAKPKEIIFWWPDVISSVGEPDAALRPILAAELRALLNNPTSWIQLSAVFGLALLHAEDIAEVVDGEVNLNPSWSENASLRNWHLKLRKGSTMYPSLKLS